MLIPPRKGPPAQPTKEAQPYPIEDGLEPAPVVQEGELFPVDEGKTPKKGVQLLSEG